MHIQILKTFTDLGGNVHIAGTREHARTSTAELWIDSKVAERVRYTCAAERLAVEEALRQAAIPASQRDNNPTAVWSLRTLPSGKLTVRHTHMGATLNYEPITLPGGKVDTKQFVACLKQAQCPDAVIEQWRTAAARPDQLEADAIRIDGERRRAAENEERIKNRVRFI